MRSSSGIATMVIRLLPDNILSFGRALSLYGSVFILAIGGFENTAFGLPIEQLKKYDFNENGRIDVGDEQSVYILHLQNRVLRKYDSDPVNGRLDPNEVTSIEKDRDVKLGRTYSETEVDEVLSDLNFGPSRQVADLADPDEALQDEKRSDQRFFLRNNRLNISVYNKSIATSAADGAEFSIVRNETANDNQFQAKGVASLVLYRNTRVERPRGQAANDLFVSGLASAVWADFDYLESTGSPDAERDKLIFGLDNQVEVFGGFTKGIQVFNFSPSFQTDFEFEGRIYGAEASWQPYITPIALGSYMSVPNLPIGFTWLAQADTLFQQVDRAGKTNLEDNSGYWWVGGALDATIWLYPEKLERKLFAKLTFPYHRDLNTGQEAWMFSSSLNYNIDDKGITALSLGYENGEDYRTGKERELFTAGIKLKF
ncbi:hypothetical protein [Roseibium sp.]|uniref:hypothetical protein n=1 Tax=Roseibium sp. TaxID=1936156 RepID=UPI003BAC417D